MDLAVVMVNSRGVIVFWNEVASAHFGHRREHVIGHDVDVLVPEDQCAAHHEGLDRAMAGGERHLEGAATHLPVRHADGRIVTHPARFHHIEDPAGTLVGAVATFGDATPGVAPWTPIDDADR